MWLSHQDMHPLDAGPADPTRRPSEPPRKVVEQATHSDAQVAAESRRIAMNPGFLKRVAEGDKDHARPRSIDRVDDSPVLRLRKVPVLSSADSHIGEHSAKLVGSAFRDSGHSPQEENTHTSPRRRLAELRNEIGPDQVVRKRLPRQSGRDAHAAAIVQEEIGLVENLAKRGILPGEVDRVRVDDVDLSCLTLSERRDESCVRLVTGQSIESNTQEPDLSTSRPRVAVTPDRLRVGNQDSCSSGSSPTNRSGSTARTSRRLTTWSAARSRT